MPPQSDDEGDPELHVGEHMPAESQLRHIGITGEQLANTEQSTVENANTPITTCISILGAGLPPVPAKLVSKIESGAIIEMADLLPEQLSTYYSNEEPKARTKKPSVTNIMEWLCCVPATMLCSICSNSMPKATRTHKRLYVIPGPHY